MVMITDDWTIARIHREMGGTALVVDLIERHSFAAIHDLDVLLVMDRLPVDMLRAVRRCAPRRVNRVSHETWLIEVERLVASWAERRAA